MKPEEVSTLSESVKKINSFDFEKALLKVYGSSKISKIILDLNTDEQLGKQGITSGGLSLPQYKPFTKELKNGLPGFAGVTDHMTLFGEGDFHKAFILDASKFPLIIDSTDSKTNDLVNRYTENIFGLTKESIQELKEQSIDEIQAANRKGIGI